MNDEVREAMQAAPHLLQILFDLMPLFLSYWIISGAFHLFLKATAVLRSSLPSDEKPKRTFQDTTDKGMLKAENRPEIGAFGYEDDKPKRLVLNEDGEIEGFE